MDKYYFRNVHIFFIDTPYRNLSQHSLVPKHRIVRLLLRQTNFRKYKFYDYQLPIILTRSHGKAYSFMSW